ncbi:MAG TPA: AMP-binding protein [Ilumatobacteraceae bacterium]|nr:AMP-binding protein [Ilumatobacteraceae bacterium]
MGDAAGSTKLSMAELTRVAAQRHGDAEAARYQRDGSWQTMSFRELWQRAADVGRGLIGLGVGIGDRVGVLSNTRIEFTIVDLAASSIGAIVVPVYPTSSPDECQWVVGDSGATVLVCETPEHVAKIDVVRGELPALTHTIIIDGAADGAIPLAEVEAAGAGGDDGELERRAAAVGPDDACLIIYTSGTTGRPKGVVLTHRGFAAARRSATEMELFGRADVVYLYLPLAHVFAQLIQADCIEVGAAIAYFGGDTTQIVAELGAVQPTVLPSVPRIFEKVYAVAMSMVPPGGEADAEAAIALGLKVRQARERGEDVSADEAAAFEKVDGEMFALVRGIFGGRINFAVSGAAPIAPEILAFFFAAGVPVYEGWGMTETTSIGTLNLPGAYRFGTIGRPVAGADVRIADDGEIEIAGEMIMREYWRNPDATAEVMTADGFLRTGDLGAIDDDGYVSITGRKKDIIITAGGKNLTPTNLEGDLRMSRWISQAVMYGDRRPYPVALVTLDPEQIVPWAEANGLPTDVAELARRPEVRDLIQADLDAANANYAQVEQVKRFAILPRDFTLDAGELTPSLKLKRNVVYATYAEEFDDLYT